MCILIVDDEPEIREMIADFLEDNEGYRVCCAASGREALEEILPDTRVDLVLSDINMPEMKGFELLNHVKELYPSVKRMLITAYNVENYFEMALKYDVGNIFVKTTPFNFQELSTGIENLLTSNIFGLERYFGPDGRRQKGSTFTVRTSAGIAEMSSQIVEQLPTTDRAKKFEVVLVELLTNALFYGVRDEDPEDKSAWDHEFELDEKDAIMVSTMADNEKYAISIVDNGGKLTKFDILYWLNRQSSSDEHGVPLGVFDSHGRGLFIARRYIDRVIINVDRNKKTEVIIINYIDQIYKGSKPLNINEV